MESKQILNEQLKHHQPLPETDIIMLNTYHPACVEDLSKQQKMSKDADSLMKDDDNQNKGILEKVRDKIHEKVATDEQLYEEKSFPEKVGDSMPSDVKEASDLLGSAFSQADEPSKKTSTNQMDLAPDVIPKTFKSAIRNQLYETTKSPSSKTQEDFQQQSLHLRGRGKTEDDPIEILA